MLVLNDWYQICRLELQHSPLSNFALITMGFTCHGQFFNLRFGIFDVLSPHQAFPGPNQNRLRKTKGLRITTTATATTTTATTTITTAISITFTPTIPLYKNLCHTLEKLEFCRSPSFKRCGCVYPLLETKTAAPIVSKQHFKH